MAYVPFNEKVKAAETEAKRFLDRINAYREAGESNCGCKESASIRRSSMDLTRSLADLRRY